MKDRDTGAAPVVPDTEDQALPLQETIEFVPSEAAEPPVDLRPRRPSNSSRRERTLAGLAHAAIILNRTGGFAGILITMVIWLTWRERSSYLCRHAAQALVWQLSLAALHALLIGGWNLLLTFNTYWVVFNPLFLSLLTPLLADIAIVLYFIWSFIALLAAIQATRGRLWRYPLTGHFSLEPNSDLR